MFFSERITLRSESSAPDEYGDTVKTYTDIDVWADKVSATRAEFYAADSSGKKVSAVFRVHIEDWGGQASIAHNSIQYDLIRDYQKGEGIIELVCTVREVS